MDCKEFLLTRRSIRKFRDEEVPINLILKAINIARYAPSAHNMQPWEFVIVKDKDKLNELASAHKWGGPIREAKVAVVVLADKEQSRVSYMVDGAIVTTYLWLALHCLGLGAVWIQTLRNPEKFAEIIKAPENKFPVAVLAIGWPAESPEPRKRKELSELVHINEYGLRLQESSLK